ncbi:MAG: hypothetical protein ACK5N8_06860 [Alphaproteobacteria bacterium]
MKTIISLPTSPNVKFSCDVTNDAGEILALDISLRTYEDKNVSMDLAANSQTIFMSRNCINKSPLILNNQLGGNIYFEDQFGDNDPYYTGYNNRYILVFDSEFRV